MVGDEWVKRAAAGRKVVSGGNGRGGGRRRHLALGKVVVRMPSILWAAPPCGVRVLMQPMQRAPERGGKVAMVRSTADGSMPLHARARVRMQLRSRPSARRPAARARRERRLRVHMLRGLTPDASGRLVHSASSRSAGCTVTPAGSMPGSSVAHWNASSSTPVYDEKSAERPT